MLLNRRCNIYRGSDGTMRHGMPEDTIWSKVATVKGRIDLMASARSRPEKTTVQLIGRLQGVLFIDGKTDLRTRDIITIDGDPYSGQQFDVAYVDAVDGLNGLHHKEAVVALRETVVSIS